MESGTAAAGFGVPGESIRLSKTAVRRKSWKLPCCGAACCCAAVLRKAGTSVRRKAGCRGKSGCCGNCGGRGWRPALRCCGAADRLKPDAGPSSSRSRSASRADSVGSWIDRLRKYQPAATGRSILRPKLSHPQCFWGSLLKTWRENDHPSPAVAAVTARRLRTKSMPSRSNSSLSISPATQRAESASCSGLGDGSPAARCKPSAFATACLRLTSTGAGAPLDVTE